MNTNIPLKKRKQKNICGGDLAAPVNCEDDKLMVDLGIRPPLFELNRMHFYKTKAEKEEVKKLKRIQHLSDNKTGFNNIHRKPVGRLVVHIKNDQHTKDFHTTANYKCRSHEVKNLLSIFHDKQIVTSVKFNGKEI